MLDLLLIRAVLLTQPLAVIRQHFGPQLRVLLREVSLLAQMPHMPVFDSVIESRRGLDPLDVCDPEPLPAHEEPGEHGERDTSHFPCITRTLPQWFRALLDGPGTLEFGD